MNQRRKFIQTFLAAALVALCLPALAAAQGTYGRPDWRNRNDNNGRYDTRYVRDSIRRLKDLSGRLQSDIDRALDRSRIDGTRREDRVNDLAKDFRRAASDLKDRSNDGRDLNRSQSEARRVLDLGARIDRVIGRQLNDNRVFSDWSQVRQELNIISDAYGFGRSVYGNDDDFRRGRNDRRQSDDPWWRRP